MAQSVTRRIERSLTASAGFRSRPTDKASICGNHQGQRSCEIAPKGRTHDCKRPVLLTKKALASRGPSTHEAAALEIPGTTALLRFGITLSMRAASSECITTGNVWQGMRHNERNGRYDVRRREAHSTRSQYVCGGEHCDYRYNDGEKEQLGTFLGTTASDTLRLAPKLTIRSVNHFTSCAFPALTPAGAGGSGGLPTYSSLTICVSTKQPTNRPPLPPALHKQDAAATTAL
jgi:hypothetical protein